MSDLFLHIDALYVAILTLMFLEGCSFKRIKELLYGYEFFKHVWLQNTLFKHPIIL